VDDTVTRPVEGLGRTIPVGTLRITVTDGADEGLTLQSRGDAVSIGTATDNDLVLTDRTVSRYHAEFRREDHLVTVRDLGSTNGTSCAGVLLEQGRVPCGANLVLGRTTIRIDDGAAVERELYEGRELAGIRGRSVIMRQLMAEVARVAPSAASVLLQGESGTGKERVAEAIHELSGRKGPLVVVDCGAMSPELVASELFGHERGAFTGAVDRRIGAFERADGGTLFLDEIGELPSELQPKLLGALERRVIRRLGGSQDVRFDVRLVSATHRDLRRAVNEGKFRLDLFYRLAVVTLRLPALRQRPEDVELHARDFADQLGAVDELEALGDEFFARLRAHSWPGNVRELRNVVEATLALGRAPVLSDVRPDSGEGSLLPGLRGLPYKRAKNELLDRFEADYLPHLVELCEGNVSEAARRAGMDRSYLFSLLRKHGIR